MKGRRKVKIIAWQLLQHPFLGGHMLVIAITNTGLIKSNRRMITIVRKLALSTHKGHRNNLIFHLKSPTSMHISSYPVVPTIVKQISEKGCTAHRSRIACSPLNSLAITENSPLLVQTKSGATGRPRVVLSAPFEVTRFRRMCIAEFRLTDGRAD